jgi:protein phosphatase
MRGSEGSNQNNSWIDLASQPTNVGNRHLLCAVDIAASTHTGHKRRNNEDHFLIMGFRRSLETISTSLDDALLMKSYNLNGHGLLVADGMGGMAGGEIASSMALAKLVELVVETPDWNLALREAKDTRKVLQRMTERFMQVDRILKKQAEQNPALTGMGTTLTVAGTLGGDLIIGHVGDSRAYLWRRGTLQQLTSDHTLAQVLIDSGVATANDPATRSMRHVLTAALGAMDERIEPQVYKLELNPGDQLLLCTDGLTEMVDDQTITFVLGEATTAAEACQTLIDQALAGGGTDNVTVVLARFEHEGFSKET